MEVTETKFGHSRPTGFQRPGDNIRKSTKWYEFRFAEVDNRPIFVLFQKDESLSFFNNVPKRSTYVEESRLQATCAAFVKRVVIISARRMSRHKNDQRWHNLRQLRRS